MTDRRSSDVLGGLPSSRPHRRSDKRGARPAENGSTGAGSTPAADASSKPDKPPPKRATASRAKPASRAKSASSAKSTGRSKASGAKSQPASPPKATSSPKAASTPKAASSPKAASTAKATPKAGTARPASRRRSTRPPLQQPAQPGGTPKAHRAAQPDPADHPDILSTALQAAAELAEIGLSVGARALRSAMSHIPRP